MLQLIHDECPAALKAVMQGTRERKDTKATKFGTLQHRWIFEPGTVTTSIVPEKYPAAKGETKDWSWNANYCKDWRTDEEEAGKVVVTSDELAKLKAINASVHSNPRARKLLASGKSEQSLFQEDSHGTLRKIRIDWLPEKASCIVDLKTTVSAHPDEWVKQAVNLGFHRRAYYYPSTLKLAGDERKDFVFLVVEKEPPFICAVYTMENMLLEAGRMEVLRDLAVYRECVETGVWPGYSDQVLSAPPWYQRLVEGA